MFTLLVVILKPDINCYCFCEGRILAVSKTWSRKQTAVVEMYQLYWGLNTWLLRPAVVSRPTAMNWKCYVTLKILGEQGILLLSISLYFLKKYLLKLNTEKPLQIQNFAKYELVLKKFRSLKHAKCKEMFI